MSVTAQLPPAAPPGGAAPVQPGAGPAGPAPAPGGGGGGGGRAVTAVNRLIQTLMQADPAELPEALRTLALGIDQVMQAKLGVSLEQAGAGGAGGAGAQPPPTGVGPARGAGGTSPAPPGGRVVTP